MQPHSRSGEKAMRKLTVRVLVAAAQAICLLAVWQIAHAQETPVDPFLSRQGSVEKLLNTSSAARQVEESGREDALRLRDQARQKYADAIRLHQSGDTETAATELSEAVRLMYAAVSASQAGGSITAKEKRDYQHRRASIDALLAAHERIAAEKGQQKEHSRLQQEVTKELAQADKLLDSGDTAGAREQVDAAYKLVMLAVEGQRQGDTLVRELNFASDEDEYLYEVDRNDTHKMLVSVLLEEKLADPRVRERTTKLVASAEALRAEAILQAKKGNFADAIKTLESATAELVKAIRSAGVYIPG